jgi:hypothetical protein
MTDNEKGRLQPTPAGHLQLATPRSNLFLLVTVVILVHILKTNLGSARNPKILMAQGIVCKVPFHLLVPRKSAKKCDM